MFLCGIKAGNHSNHKIVTSLMPHIYMTCTSRNERHNQF